MDAVAPHRTSADDRRRERGALASWMREVGSSKKIDRGRVIVEGGVQCRQAMLLTGGWAMRVHNNANGHVQTTAFYLTDDLINPCCMTEPVTQQPVVALTGVTVQIVEADRMIARLGQDQEALKDALSMLVRETDFLREALAAVGSQQGPGRLATFLYQTRRRLIANGSLDEDAWEFPLPLTQEQLGFALGVTNVHVNRIVKQLREDGILTIGRGVCQIQDFDRFEMLAEPLKPKLRGRGGQYPAENRHAAI